MIVQNNIPAYNASRNKGINNFKMKKSLEKLSSGYRINRAGDDAAGLAISEGMRAQIRGLNQAMKNADDGIGMTEVGDGALTEVHAMLSRLKTLAIESANGTYNTVARANLDAEKEELLAEIDRIGATSNFGEIPLFDGAKEHPSGIFEPPDQKDDITLQIGYFQKETLDVPRYYMSSNALLLDTMDFTSVNAANASVDVIENAIEAVADIRADFGAAQNHLEHTHNNISITSENMTASEARIRDTDMAQEITDFTKANIVYQASQSMVAQANSMPEMILSLLQ